MIQLDTNILGRMTDSTDPQCLVARQAVHRLLARDERLVIVSQNCYEFWSIATRAKGLPPLGQNGLGLSVSCANQWLVFFRRRFVVLADPTNLLDRWHFLVATDGIRGLKSHDMRLVAAMSSYGISRILTFNAADFKPYSSIRVVDPATV